MCGIVGKFNFGNQFPVEASLINEMMHSIIHRGPDEDGCFIQKNLGMGMRRLSIIDLAGGTQPISNEDKTIWIVFNGEIYNYPSLRQELQSCGHRFKTNSDTETIIHAYEEWGIDGFSRLNGMFGFALWDATKQQLLLARDPFGIKPLYFWHNANSVIFGSEIRSILLNPEVERRVDIEALHEFLTITYVPSPKTAFENIFKLRPGYALICNENGLTDYRYYNEIPQSMLMLPEEELVEALRVEIETAVKRQMIADVPVGAMLSGGVDSSTVASLMTQIANQPINTFTVGFTGNFADNELEFARQHAKHINSNHHEVIISADEFSSFLPHAIYHLEEPVATASTLAMYKVCELARKHVKVVLTGQGADEPFAGYHRYLGERYSQWYRYLPETVRNHLILPLVKAMPRNERLKRAVNSLGEPDNTQRILNIYNTFDPDIQKSLYQQPVKESNGYFKSIYEWQKDVQHLDSLTQMLYLDARLYQADNLAIYGDKMSMANSLEARVPFLDLELMKFVERIPPNLKIKRRVRKYILKKAAAKWIPEEVITRRKIGFATPVDDWFRGEWHNEIHDRLLSPNSGCRNFFNHQTIHQILQEHHSGQEDHKRLLFSLLTFEIWYGTFIQSP